MLRRSPLKRGKPLARRTGLQSRTPLVRRKPLLATQAAPRKSGRPLKPQVRRGVPTGPDRYTVDFVLERDQWSCRVCDEGLVGTRGVDWSIHHLRRRSQGGTHDPQNLISLCGNGTTGCHGRIHSYPQWARDHGYLIGREVAA